METCIPERKAYNRHNGDTDYCKAIIEWEMSASRNADSFSLKDVKPGSSEDLKIDGYLREYTKFNNMLRYNMTLAPAYTEKRKDKTVNWDPFFEYMPRDYPNRTAELFEERRAEQKNKELIIN